MPTFKELTNQVTRLSRELDKRVLEHKRLEPYYDPCDGQAGIPQLIQEARMTRLYRWLIPVADAPWGSLVVDSKLDRLEVSGISDAGNDAGAQAAWGLWQDCYMDSESKLAHAAALLDGRCFATVWPDPDTGKPDIALDDCTQMVVEYAEGSRHKRVAALRRWSDGTRKYATLYRPEGLYKFQTKKVQAEQDWLNSTTPADEWEKRIVLGEDWPAPNIYGNPGSIPVVELAVNRRLKPGPFPYARGEFAHCTGLIDRINLLTFLGLVVAVWQGFPIRGVIGQKMKREVLVDDDGNPLIDEATGKPKTRGLPPLDTEPGGFGVLEDPDAKTFQFDAADRKNLSIFAELDQLAVITKTARHYFPLEQGMSNLSAEAIVASEGGMLAAVTGHKASMDDGWEESLRLGGQIAPVKFELSTSAELQWKKHESRSLAEQADAFVKLAGSGLPWMAAAEYALNASGDQLRDWEVGEASSALGTLIRGAMQPQNGNGVPVPTG